MVKARFFLPLLLLVLASLACQTILGSTPAPPADTSDVPQDSSNGMPVAFQDDFSSENSGWDVADWENGSTSYVNGVYEITVKTPQYDIWGNPKLYFDGDVRTEVVFVKKSGPEMNDIGLICRYAETESAYSFYYLVVGSNGFAGAYKVVDGSPEVLAELEPGSVQAVHPGSQPNHLRLDCLGSQLALYVNGEEAISVSDTALTAGDVGLLAGVYDEANLKVWFDDFKVYTP